MKFARFFTLPRVETLFLSYTYSKSSGIHARSLSVYTHEILAGKRKISRRERRALLGNDVGIVSGVERENGARLSNGAKLSGPLRALDRPLIVKNFSPNYLLAQRRVYIPFFSLSLFSVSSLLYLPFFVRSGKRASLRWPNCSLRRKDLDTPGVFRFPILFSFSSYSRVYRIRCDCPRARERERESERRCLTRKREWNI